MMRDWLSRHAAGLPASAAEERGHTTMAGGPVVFVHGLWLHASSWGPWEELFRESGYEPLAPGWPGTADAVEEARNNPGRAAGKGIDEIVGHYAQVIEGLADRPV